MEEVKYIPGGLVANHNGTVLRIVDMVGGFLYTEYQDGSPGLYISRKDVVPIRLTPKILENNGWKRDGGQYIFNSGREKELTGFFIEMFENVRDILKHRYFQILHENKVICGCFYVHQLQHLLLGLGLSSDLKV